MKFSGGGPAGGVVEAVGCSLLILELFVGLARQKPATSFANELLLMKEQTPIRVRTSKRLFCESAVGEKLDRATKLKGKALETWQPTEIL